MSVADVERTVRDVSRTAPDFANIRVPHELSMRYGLIDPILWALGWRTWLNRECEPDFDLGLRGRIDYALFDDTGEVAIYILVQNSYVRIQSARSRLRERLRGLDYGVGVLVRGSHWEIYDLSRRSRDFDDKQVDILSLGPDGEDHPGYVAEALFRWIGKIQWWNTGVNRRNAR